MCPASATAQRADEARGAVLLRWSGEPARRSPRSVLGTSRLRAETWPNGRRARRPDHRSPVPNPQRRSSCRRVRSNRVPSAGRCPRTSARFPRAPRSVRDRAVPRARPGRQRAVSGFPGVSRRWWWRRAAAPSTRFARSGQAISPSAFRDTDRRGHAAARSIGARRCQPDRAAGSTPRGRKARLPPSPAARCRGRRRS